MSLPIATSLSALDGANGLKLAADTWPDSVSKIASAGDINGDGFADVIMSADFYSHTTYVLFGRASGYPAVLSTDALNGSNGFRMEGTGTYGGSGGSVASAGDINGDGFDDLIIGSTFRAGRGTPGGAFVVFGKAGGFDPLISLPTMRPDQGFHITAPGVFGDGGWSVASAGDVNGDGLDDIMISNPSDGGFGGSVSVVFGRSTGFGADISTETLNGADGFRILGNTHDLAGLFVAGAGDVNGDGFADIIVGTGQDASAAAYVVFGHAGGFPATVQLGGLMSPGDGFAIEGGDPFSYHTVASAGDVNGDGLADIIIGAPLASTGGAWSGASYVVFGRADSFIGGVNLATLDGHNGFRIDGAATSERSGSSVAAAGDLNADGFGDIVVNGSGGIGYFPSNAYPGGAYVIYGHAGGFAPVLSLAALPGDVGFRIDGTASSVSSAGDFNGDGAADLAIGGLVSGYVLFGTQVGGAAPPAAAASDWLT